MSVFRNYQVAHDIARFTMIMYDCVDTIRYFARGLEPDSGNEVVKMESAETLLSDLQQRVRNMSNSALVNHNALTNYIGKIGLADAKAAVTAVFGVDGDLLQEEITKLRDIAQYAYNNVLNATSLEDMIPFADYVDTNLAKWASIRRRWAL